MGVTLKQALFEWSMPVANETQLRSADVILTHEFADHSEKISPTTRSIIQLAMKLHRLYEHPIICQNSGRIVLAKHGIVPVGVIQENLKYSDRIADTEEVSRQAAIICKERRWRRVIICTHSYHAWRAGHNLLHHGLVPLFPDLSDVPYAGKECPNIALQSGKRYFAYESFARLGYYWGGLLN